METALLAARADDQIGILQFGQDDFEKFARDDRLCGNVAHRHRRAARSFARQKDHGAQSVAGTLGEHVK